MIDIHIELGEFEEAKLEAQKALEITTEAMKGKWPHLTARAFLGASLAGLGEYDQAIPLLTEAHDQLVNCEEDEPEPDRSNRIRQAAERLAKAQRDFAASQ